MALKTIVSLLALITALSKPFVAAKISKDISLSCDPNDRHMNTRSWRALGIRHLKWYGLGDQCNSRDPESMNVLDAECQFQIGEKFAFGLYGSNARDEVALKWYRLAAMQNKPIAQSQVASILGRNIWDDEAVDEAIYWYETAARNEMRKNNCSSADALPGSAMTPCYDNSSFLERLYRKDLQDGTYKKIGLIFESRCHNRNSTVPISIIQSDKWKTKAQYWYNKSSNTDAFIEFNENQMYLRNYRTESRTKNGLGSATWELILKLIFAYCCLLLVRYLAPSWAETHCEMPPGCSSLLRKCALKLKKIPAMIHGCLVDLSNKHIRYTDHYITNSWLIITACLIVACNPIFFGLSDRYIVHRSFIEGHPDVRDSNYQSTQNRLEMQLQCRHLPDCTHVSCDVILNGTHGFLCNFYSTWPQYCTEFHYIPEDSSVPFWLVLFMVVSQSSYFLLFMYPERRLYKFRENSWQPQSGRQISLQLGQRLMKQAPTEIWSLFFSFLQTQQLVELQYQCHLFCDVIAQIATTRINKAIPFLTYVTNVPSATFKDLKSVSHKMVELEQTLMTIILGKGTFHMNEFANELTSTNMNTLVEIIGHGIQETFLLGSVSCNQKQNYILRNLTLQPGNHVTLQKIGFTVTNTKQSLLDCCEITGFDEHGIFVTGSSSKLIVRDCVVHSNVKIGLLLQKKATVDIEGTSSDIKHNGWNGVFLMNESLVTFYLNQQHQTCHDNGGKSYRMSIYSEIRFDQSFNNTGVVVVNCQNCTCSSKHFSICALH